ncbi:MAG: PHP domain-containing protein [Gemmatimonadetes bacterium]|nr:PHP domain-containing protein [Gemmatimonadota bacterium]
MRVDLHIHTTASDGAWSPERVVRGAREGGLDLIAIADHDTTSGYSTAERTGREVRVQVVPAVEVSATHDKTDIHILGYFVDSDSPGLLAQTSATGDTRVRRMKEMVGRLRSVGIAITYEDVIEVAGPDRGSLARPHLAKALVRRGAARNVQDAFDRYIADGSPFYLPVDVMSPRRAVQVIREAGGIAVWAHPPFRLLDPMLPSLVRAGLGGLEVYRPSHGPGDVLRLEELCRTHGLLMSGGSDWHNPDSGKALGDFFVDAFEIEPLLEAGGI